jgi:phosphate-selective porin OprO/OprP
MKRTVIGLVLGLCVAVPAAAQEKKEPGFTWKEHPTVRVGEWLRVDFRARVQSDFRESPFEDPKDDADVARKRVALEGRVGRMVDYQIEYEIGAREWRDVYVDYRQFKPAQVQAGAFKVPFGLEETTSITKLDFVYRSRISSRLAPGRARGVMLHGKLLNSRLGYEGGIFTGDGDNALSSKITRVSGGRTVATRVVIEPFHKSKREIADIQFGAAATLAEVPLGLPGIRARTVFGASFFDSDVWVQGRRQRTGLEARWKPGPVTVQAEYIRLSDQRREQAVDGGDLAPLVAHGWYVSGSYRRGPIEAASRFETLSFGDTSGHPEASTSRRAEVVLGNSDRALTFGVNYYVNRWVKIQANLIREQLLDPSAGPLPTTPSFWSRALRIQVTL